MQQTTPAPPATRGQCWICAGSAVPDDGCAAYAYVLGHYFGSGHLETAARIPVLRISTCTDYPAVAAEIRRALAEVRDSQPALVAVRRTARMQTVQSYWEHWPCLIPQHGPGRNHERPIVLEPWQRDVVRAHPWPLIRGLIHSDGCRAINRVLAGGRSYRYPRYFFSNTSSDILSITAAALDHVGVAWRYNRPDSISIARREAVAAMDAHVGPKR